MLIDVVVSLVILGVLLYILTLIPMDETIKQVIRVIVILAILLWVISMFSGYCSPFFGPRMCR